MSTRVAIRVSTGIIAVCLGTVLMILAIPAALAAGTIEGTVGRSGVVTQPLGTLAAAEGDRAVVVDDVRARIVIGDVPSLLDGALSLAGTDMQGLAEQVGSVRLLAQMSSDDEGFIGMGSVDAVNDYLAGAPYSVAVQPAVPTSDPWPTVSVPGDLVPPAPASESVWTASASGTSMALDAQALDGGTLVLMRADAAAGPVATLRLEYRVSGASTALQSTAVTAAALVLGGLGLIALGGWLVVGRRRTE